MRFTRLLIESFMAIQRADIEFGPGLNILYGPNDLGKSTLARAIRAALLVPPGSAESAHFEPWYADATPSVSLTFVDGSAQFWRVSKNFGDARAGAELRHSKDGVSFTVDCKAREVEEKLRALLGWGIPAPGGKGAPRGLPSSFLANALLSEDTDVNAILGEGLAGDLEGSGKVRLTKALATLAQDPILKKVLDEAQREVDDCFTPQGRRKRGQTSKFTEAGNAIKKLEDERVALQRQQVESSTIEDHVRGLRERRDHADTAVKELNASLAEIGEQLALTRRREEARTHLETARKALALVVAHADRVTALALDLERLAGESGSREASKKRADAQFAEAEAAQRAAVEVHREATSEKGAHQRELRQAQLAGRAATLGAKKQDAEMRRSTLEAALRTRTTAEAARQSSAVTHAELQTGSRQLIEARVRMAALEQEDELARALIAYGRWRAAVSAAEEAQRETTAAGGLRDGAGRKDSEAAALEMRAGAMEEDGRRRAASLPLEPDLAPLIRLEQEVALAEAAIGGGLSVTVRPHAAVALRVLADQKAVLDERDVTGDRAVEAERRVRVFVGELVDIEVTAGGADQRRTAESARTRWNTEVVPELKRAGVESVAELSAACAEVAKIRKAAVELRTSANAARGEAARLRERAAFHEQQVTKLTVDPGEVEARSVAIGNTSRGVLDVQFVNLGKTWESQADARASRKAKELKSAQTEVMSREQAMKVAEYKASEAERASTEASAVSNSAFTALGSPDAEALLRAVVDELDTIARGAAEVASERVGLGAEASTLVANAHRKVEAAVERLRIAREAQDTAMAALDGARAALNARTGEHRALAEQLAAMNRDGAAALVAQRGQELQGVPAGPPASDADVERVEQHLETASRELDQAKEELHKGEGALSKVGGAAVRESVERLEEAVADAHIRWRELEIDADAWKLLLDTLRAVENEEGAHLGRALAGPVATRFAELTSGRYPSLRLDATLKTEAVEVAGGGAQGADVLEALSLGTRNQLATLIRLTIADQLGSAIVLDDHLAHTDPSRLAWFRGVLMKTALNAQIIILTCRPEDYLTKEELPVGQGTTRDLAGGAIRAINVAQVVRRWAPGVGRAAPVGAGAAGSESGS
jgi:uncharacterized protein YhaN